MSLMRRIILFLLFFSFVEAKHCYFIPPAGWEIAQLKAPSPHVKIGFLGQGTGEFRPSINLSVEENVDVPLREYIKAVKQLQTSEPSIQWRDLGSFSMRCGKGRLIEITNTSAWGEIKILQALFIADQNAYILTVAILKEDFFKFQQDLLKSLSSLDLVDDLFSLIEDGMQRSEFAAFFAALGTAEKRDLEWENLQKHVSLHANLGAYWQFLILTEGHARIYTDSPLEDTQELLP